jgi:hypothetical protein
VDEFKENSHSYSFAAPRKRKDLPVGRTYSRSSFTRGRSKHGVCGHRACGGLGTSALAACGTVRRRTAQVRVDRSYQHALDDARDRATQFGIIDDRPEIVALWSDAHAWFVPPVPVTGDLLGSSVGYELLVGFTRLGNLLGLLDRQGIPEVQRHLVLMRRGMEPD